MKRVTCSECKRIARNRTGLNICQKCRVIGGELNRPNRKQIGKIRPLHTRG